MNQMAARNWESERFESNSEVEAFFDWSLETAWPMSRQYTR